MIDEEDPPVRVHALLPALGQRPEIVVGPLVGHGRGSLVGHGAGAPRPGVHPRGGPLVVIDEEPAAVGGHLHGPARRETLGQVLQVVLADVVRGGRRDGGVAPGGGVRGVVGRVVGLEAGGGESGARTRINREKLWLFTLSADEGRHRGVRFQIKIFNSDQIKGA